MTDGSDLYDALQEYGEIHVTLDSGAEYHLHKHDVELKPDGDIVVDSKEGRWRFDGGKIEQFDYPDSHKE